MVKVYVSRCPKCGKEIASTWFRQTYSNMKQHMLVCYPKGGMPEPVVEEKEVA